LVYTITNPNGKTYVGQSVDILRREKNYKNLQVKQQPRIYNSISKYGWENHIFEIIEECDINQLHEREIYWKLYYLDLHNQNWGMVLFCELYDSGGGPRSESVKIKMSQIHKGKITPPDVRKKIGDANRGTIFPPEVREKMGRKKGSTYSDEDKMKISIGLKGKPKPEGFGEKISKANSGREKTEKEISYLQKTHPSKKPVLQIDPITYKVINEFSSMKEAGRILGINPNGITEVICGRQKTSFGFIWKLKE